MSIIVAYHKEGSFSMAHHSIVTTDPHTIALTFAQKARLLVRGLPLVTFLLLGAGYFLLVERGLIPAPTSLFYLFLGVVILVLGYQTVQALRDVVAGVARVEDDFLNRSYRSGGRGPGRFVGHFERLGKLRLLPAVHFQNAAGQPYRVVYSPASKLVWQLEPIPHSSKG